MNLTVAGIAALVLIIVFFAAGWKKGLIRELISLVYVFLLIAIVWFVHPHMESFLRDNTPLYGTLEKNCGRLVDSVSTELSQSVMDASAQAAFLENIPLPGLIVKELAGNNTAEVYDRLGVTTFTDYIRAFLTEKLFSGISILASCILAGVLIGILSALLNAVAGLPGIRAANRLGGGLIGAGKSLIVIWIILLLLTVLYQTEAGRRGLELVQKDSLLSFFYEKTIFPLLKR